MNKIKDSFCGYLIVGNDTYTYSVSSNIVTLLPAQSDISKRNDSFDQIRFSNTDLPEYLYGIDDDGKIAMLRKGKLVTNRLGTNVAIKFATPIIIKACGNAQGFFDIMTEPWNKFHAITFYGGNINALYDPGFAIEPIDIRKYYKNDGEREIKVRPRNDYTRTIKFKIEDEDVTLTFSIGQSAESSNMVQMGSYDLGRLDAFIRFSFDNSQAFDVIEKYYAIARKFIALLTAQNNVCFQEVYLSQRNDVQQYFKTGVCKIFNTYDNYSIKKCHNVIFIGDVFEYIPDLIAGIICGKADSLLELLPEDNKWTKFISIKNVQDLCTALEVSYHLNSKRKREKDVLIEELKKKIKNTIAEFVKEHGEIDVNKETTISSAFQYLDYTLKQKILTLYNENQDIIDRIVAKYALPQLDEKSIDSFVKLRNNKTHSGIIEWDESVKLYSALLAMVYVAFFEYVGIPHSVIQTALLSVF